MNYTFSLQQVQKTSNLDANVISRQNKLSIVYRLQLTYYEFIDIVDLKHIPTKRTGYSLTPGIYEVIELNNTLKYILSDIVKVSVTVDDSRLKSKLQNN